VQNKVIRLVGRHYHLHPLVPIEGIPNAEANAVVLGANEIWLLAVHEMYCLCRSENLPAVFRYLWKNWYRGGEMVPMGSFQLCRPDSKGANYYARGSTLEGIKEGLPL
jgi:hypothetical protein